MSAALQKTRSKRCSVELAAVATIVAASFLSVNFETVNAAKADKVVVKKAKKEKPAKKVTKSKAKKAVVHNGPTIVYDPRSGQVLSQVDAGAPWYPASLTKLMTAYIAFQDVRAGRFKIKEKITVSKYARSMPPSKLGVPEGAQLPLDFALRLLLIRSTNDIAVAIAEHIEGSVSAFAERMNQTALQLGMTGTHFANPHGLPDPRQITTARDMALLAGAILTAYPEHRKFFDARNVRIGKKRFRNRNTLVRNWEPADGMKTGFICNSAYNLVASATLDNRQLVAVVLGAKNGAIRAKKAQELLEAGFGGEGATGNGQVPQPISAVRNEARPGGKVPQDLSQVACKGRPAYRLVPPGMLTGAWGIALGKFAKATDAHTVMTRRLVNGHQIFSGGRGAVIRMPDRKGYLAVVGRLEAPRAEKVCTEMRSRSEVCQILSPEVFSELEKEDLARMAAERERRRKAKAKKRARKKRKKKTAKKN
ncbi:MAG: D-alanyl-D-alanine carboxypeptidase family protein [Hyphomicrobiales bacterium]